jgi:hypothetical protein
VALRLEGVTGKITYAIYYLLPRLDWAFSVRQFLIFHDPMPGFAVWVQAMLFYGGYSALLILAAWLLFRRRALTT